MIATISETELRYMAWLHELDAWTEYWDIYHPETRGRYYFGDGKQEPGLLTLYLGREQRPPAFEAWTRFALQTTRGEEFEDQIRKQEVAAAVLEVDRLVLGIFQKHFPGDAGCPLVQADYLEASLRCGMNDLPPAEERGAKIASDDWRKRTSSRHMIDGDIMWFSWGLHLEAARLLTGSDDSLAASHALMMAGVAVGCSADFAWRGHRRTRPEYLPGEQTLALLRRRGLQWARDFNAGAAEVRALYRWREWGHE